jgi:glycosyltransferase involved in cell wall biosynthesis
MRAFQPHVVHTHTAKAGFLGRLAAGWVRPRPVVVHTFHGHVLDGYFGPLASLLFRHAEREMARRSDALVAVSPSVQHELLKVHGVGRPDQYHVIPSGYPELSLKGALSLRGDLALGEGPVGGVVGRWVPIKGIDLVLEAIPSLVEKVPGLRILLAGDGPLRGRVESHAARSLWKRALIPLGNRLDVERVYKTLDFLLLPSRKEGLPTVLLEAVQAGVPIAAARIPGVTDLFEHEKTCLLFEPGSVRAFAEAAARLARDEELRRDLAARAARTIPGRVPDYPAVALAHARLYNALLQRRDA